MSINGISSSSVYQTNSAQSYRSRFDQIKDDFQKLGQDLQAGNLSQAQQDFTSLSQSIAPAQPNTNSPISQALATLGQDLQSGNLSGAQQDYSSLLQGLQSSAGQVHHHHHHHHAGANGQQNSAISQAFATLGQDLQSGDLSGAQQAYSTIQNYLQNLGYSSSSSSISSSAAQAAGSSVNFTV